MPLSRQKATSSAEDDGQKNRSTEDAVAGRDFISRMDRMVRTASFLLVCSLFIPWFQVGASAPQQWFPMFKSIEGTWVFAPAWSAFFLSILGTKFSLHFLNVLVGLSVAIVVMTGARKTMSKNPMESSMLLWVSVSFTVVGLLFFAMFFPRIGYVNNGFWVFGSSSCTILGCETSFYWLIMPGPFIALISLSLQIQAASRLVVSDWQPGMGVKRSEPPGNMLFEFHDKRTRLLSWGIAWTIIAAGVWVGLSYSPQLTAKGLANEWDLSFKSFKPGDIVTLVDRAMSASLLRTSYGEHTLMTLGEGGQVTVLLRGNQKDTYPVGSLVSIPVRFDWYYYNDIPFVWSDVAFAPLPLMLDILVVFQAVSRVAGITLFAASNETFPGGLQVFGDLDLPFDKFGLTLTKASYPYLSESTMIDGGWQPGRIDEMETLHAGASDNGTVNFIDANSDGLLNTGDAFDLSLPPTKDEFHFDTYILNIAGPLTGFAYIIVGSRGPLLFYLHESETLNEAIYSLDMPLDQLNGNNCSSRVVIDRKMGRPEPASDFEIVLNGINWQLPEFIPAATNGTTLTDGARVEFVDQAMQGVLDEGDYWMFDNLTKYRYYSLQLRNDIGEITNEIQWACGLGFNKLRLPEVKLSAPIRDPMDPKSFLIGIESVKGLPAGFTSGYSASLVKNGVRLLPISVESSRLAQSPGYQDEYALPQGPSLDGQGTWLSFNDSNANRFLDPGDYLAVNNTASGAKYEISLYYINSDKIIATVNWTS